MACLFFQCLAVPVCLAADQDSAPIDNDGNPQLEPILEKALQAYGDKQNLSRFADSAQFTGLVYKEEDHWHKRAYKYVRKTPAWRTDVEETANDNHSTPNNSDSKLTSTIFDGTNYWRVTEPPVGAEAGGTKDGSMQSTPTGSPTGEDNTSAQNPGQYIAPASVDSAGKYIPPPDQGMPPLAPAFKRPSGPVIKRLSPEQSQWLSDQAQRQPFLLAYWQTPSYHFKLLGETSYKQVPVYAIQVTEKDNSPTLIYLDRSNYLVVAITFQSWQSGESADQSKKVNVAKEYSENRPALESIWPFKETLLVDNHPVSVFALSNISPATEVSPDYFKPPSLENQGYAAHQLRLPKSITVPFEYCQSEIVCRGKIDNYEPLWFLIDTGTSDTIIDRSVAAQCLLVRGNDFHFSSFRGNIPAQTTKLDRLELGKLIINNIDAQITDLLGPIKTSRSTHCRHHWYECSRQLFNHD